MGTGVRLSRRQWLAATGGALAIGCGAGSGGAPSQPAVDCAATSSATAGPFYLAGSPELIQIPFAGDGRALRVEGRVQRAQSCEALAGARLDLWQCDDAGNYDVKGYNGRGVVVCDADGRYRFDTIVPANYEDNGTMRPAHIHFTIAAAGQSLTTQLYFAGDPHLDGDRHVHDDLIKPLARWGDGFRVEFDVFL